MNQRPLRLMVRVIAIAIAIAGLMDPAYVGLAAFATEVDCDPHDVDPGNGSGAGTGREPAWLGC